MFQLKTNILTRIVYKGKEWISVKKENFDKVRVPAYLY